MNPSASPFRNRLAGETSPYLLQHAANPVEWYPWGEEALQRAQTEGKPILLSIGYSACHWCHVMAHESFEDPATAALMNELFINIKVDREERPDLDKIYQLAHQLLTQRGGGWPLTMFLTPNDRHPFFGGTYFPDAPRHAMPSFQEVLRRVAEYYRTRTEEIRAQNGALMQVFKDLTPGKAAADEELNAAPTPRAREALAAEFDSQAGGFGTAPKFPHPGNIEFLLRQWRASAHDEEPDLQALYMATLTLTRMAEGGIYDQLGGGFARYCVDQHWMIPHFEKMLYDNAQLLRTYANATVATGESLFARIATETAHWIIRDLQSSQGGFWSTLDADSEGHEGKFYVWTPEEVRQHLSPELFDLFVRRFGLDRPANFEGEWHLYMHRSIADVAMDLSMPAALADQRLQLARHLLLETRNRRVWPGRDEKILAGWNGLTIAGLSVAARALHQIDLHQAATRAIDFIRSTMLLSGRLYAVHKDGQTRFPAYLDDYAFLLDGLLESLQTRWRGEDLTFAIQLADTLLLHFENREAGGFFFTADDHEALIHRPKSFSDEAVPSGNAIAAFALNRLGLLLGESRYLQAAERTLRAGWDSLQRYPHAHTALLMVLDEVLHPPQIIIIRSSGAQGQEWQEELAKLYAPRRMVLTVPADAADLPDAISSKSAKQNTVAYVCLGSVCSEPIRSLAALVAVARS